MQEANITKLSPSEAVHFLDRIDKETSIRNFFDKGMDDPSFSAYLSYWEKWLPSRHQKIIDEMIERKRKKNGFYKNLLPLGLEKRFSKKELETIFSNTGAIQMTFGCSGGCQYCGLDALPGIREHIPYYQLENLFNNFGQLLGITFPYLYWASEPYDYKGKKWFVKKTYEDVQNLAWQKANYYPHITSRVIFDKKWFGFVSKRGPRNRFSVFGVDHEKIDELEKMTSVVLNGKGRLHYQGLGKSYKKNDKFIEPTAGIGCFNGILLTPRGIYNLVQVPASLHYPQGQIVSPFISLNGEGIKIGEQLEKVLQKSLVRYNRLTSSAERMSQPFLTMYQNNKNYDIAVDSDGKIQKIFPSIRPEIDKIMNAILKKKIEIAANNSSSDASAKDELKKQIRLDEAKIRYLFKKRIREIEPSHSINNFFRSLKNMLDKNFLLPTDVFEIKKTEKGFYFIRNSRLFYTISYRHNHQPLRIPILFKSCKLFDNIDQLDNKINITAGELLEIYGNSIKIELCLV